LWLNELWALVGQAFSLPDFCHSLLRERKIPPGYFALAAVLFIQFAAAAVLIDRIAVVVADRAIKESDIDREIRVVSFLNKEKPDFSPSGRKQAAQRLIDQTLIRRDLELGRYNTAGPNEVNELYQQVRARYPSDEAFQAALHKTGLTAEVLKNALTWQVTVLQYIQQRFRPATGVPEQEARQYYQEHRAAFRDVTFAQARPRIDSVLRGNEVNQAFEAWLQQARPATKIRYLEEELR
jgi:hypothetical protein